VLCQVDLLLELLSLCLRDDGHGTSEDHIDLSHLLVVDGGGIGLAVLAPMGFLGHRCYWWWHLFVI
jgi:hypothetical protein